MNERKPKSLPELAQEAIDVQNACNMGGVSRSFAEAIKDLHSHVSGTDAIRCHPITRLWISKIADLAGLALTESTWKTLCDADVSCQSIAKGELK